MSSIYLNVTSRCVVEFIFIFFVMTCHEKYTFCIFLRLFYFRKEKRRQTLVFKLQVFFSFRFGQITAHRNKTGLFISRTPTFLERMKRKGRREKSEHKGGYDRWLQIQRSNVQARQGSPCTFAPSPQKDYREDSPRFYEGKGRM